MSIATIVISVRRRWWLGAAIRMLALVNRVRPFSDAERERAAEWLARHALSYRFPGKSRG